MCVCQGASTRCPHCVWHWHFHSVFPRAGTAMKRFICSNVLRPTPPPNECQISQITSTHVRTDGPGYRAQTEPSVTVMTTTYANTPDVTMFWQLSAVSLSARFLKKVFIYYWEMVKINKQMNLFFISLSLDAFTLVFLPVDGSERWSGAEMTSSPRCALRPGACGERERSVRSQPPARMNNASRALALLYSYLYVPQRYIAVSPSTNVRVVSRFG